MVAHWAHNPKVVGSSPAPATRKASWPFRPGSFVLFPRLDSPTGGVPGSTDSHSGRVGVLAVRSPRSFSTDGRRPTLPVEETGNVEVDERRYRIPYILIMLQCRAAPWSSRCHDVGYQQMHERAYTGKEISWVLSKYYEIVG